MAKRFFYVCAGLLCLAAVYHFGANSVVAQTGSPQEVAMLSGELPSGGTIPLPRYADGTEALESECRWIVSPRYMDAQGGPVRARRQTDGRVIRVYWCTAGCGPAVDCDPDLTGCGLLHPGTANYLIVAVRSSGPTSTQRESFGSVKARYR